MSSSTLKDFVFLERLGKGSYGTVYKVRRKVDNLLYVIKQINISPLSRSEQQEAINEVRILASLDHPNIIKYFDSFIDRDKLNIVMELAQNGTLQHFLRKQNGLLPENTVWKFFLQMARGLQHLHKKKILHRDMKSLNVFLDGDNNVKIGDLGVAKVLGTETNFAHTVIGTPYYLSPELCEDKPYNAKSDVWALGCILYELCTKRHPFDAHNQGALILKIIRGHFQPPSSLYSKNMHDTISSCLTKDISKRPSIETLLTTSFILQKGLELDHPTPSLAQAPMPKRSEREAFEPTTRDVSRNRPRHDAQAAKVRPVPDSLPPNPARHDGAAGGRAESDRHAARRGAPPRAGRAPAPSRPPAVPPSGGPVEASCVTDVTVGLIPGAVRGARPASANRPRSGAARSRRSQAGAVRPARSSPSAGPGSQVAAPTRRSASQIAADEVAALPEHVVPAARGEGEENSARSGAGVSRVRARPPVFPADSRRGGAITRAPSAPAWESIPDWEPQKNPKDPPFSDYSYESRLLPESQDRSADELQDAAEQRRDEAKAAPPSSLVEPNEQHGEETHDLAMIADPTRKDTLHAPEESFANVAEPEPSKETDDMEPSHTTASANCDQDGDESAESMPAFSPGDVQWRISNANGSTLHSPGSFDRVIYAESVPEFESEGVREDVHRNSIGRHAPESARTSRQDDGGGTGAVALENRVQELHASLERCIAKGEKMCGKSAFAAQYAMIRQRAIEEDTDDCAAEQEDGSLAYNTLSIELLPLLYQRLYLEVSIEDLANEIDENSEGDFNV